MVYPVQFSTGSPVRPVTFGHRHRTHRKPAKPPRPESSQGFKNPFVRAANAVAQWFKAFFAGFAADMKLLWEKLSGDKSSQEAAPAELKPVTDTPEAHANGSCCPPGQGCDGGCHH